MNQEPMVSSASRPTLRPRGSNQVGMRQFNERVVLQAIRLSGSASKAEIARMTHLTAQTVQLIIGRLEADGLVLKLNRIRGKVGQPSVPMALNPDGAFSIGLTIGRHNAEVLLVDFCARVRLRLSAEYTFPEPDVLFGEVQDMVTRILQTLDADKAKLLCGIGVAAPLSLGSWQELLGMEPDIAQRWADIDISERIGDLFDVPISFVKDTTAACVAELVVGRGHAERNFLYYYVGTFIGGGIVLDSQLHAGAHGNAGAVGSLPIGMASASQQHYPPQLLSLASLHQLQVAYRAAGLDVSAWKDARAHQAPWLEHTQAWLAKASTAIAMAISSAACFLDIDRVILDGSFSRSLLDALIDHVQRALELYDWQGVAKPTIMAGQVGSDARGLGGALLPLYANFMPNRDLFLKAQP